MLNFVDPPKIIFVIEIIKAKNGYNIVLISSFDKYFDFNDKIRYLSVLLHFLVTAQRDPPRVRDFFIKVKKTPKKSSRDLTTTD